MGRFAPVWFWRPAALPGLHLHRPGAEPRSTAGAAPHKGLRKGSARATSRSSPPDPAGEKIFLFVFLDVGLGKQITGGAEQARRQRGKGAGQGRGHRGSAAGGEQAHGRGDGDAAEKEQAEQRFESLFHGKPPPFNDAAVHRPLPARRRGLPKASAG